MKAILSIVFFAALTLVFLLFTRGRSDMTSPTKSSEPTVESTKPAQASLPRETAKPEKPAKLAKATFGTGCFWCTEAIFQRLEGVYSVTSGYTGGSVVNPTYEQVCAANTGHAEVIQLEYDPDVITFKDLLEVFWKTHDPTTLNRQGNDRGPQYRSAIFYHTPEQKSLAEEYKKKLDQSGAFEKPIVTEITAFSVFYPAEQYHQNYYNDNSRQGYCEYVIQPKLDKFKQAFQSKLKKN